MIVVENFKIEYTYQQWKMRWKKTQNETKFYVILHALTTVFGDFSVANQLFGPNYHAWIFL